MSVDAVSKGVVLEAQAVVAGYGEVDILHAVSLRVERREMVAVIGPNGAGKSTLLKAIFGLLPVRSGEVFLKGEDVTNKRPDQVVVKGLSYVPQVDNVFPSLTILENLQMGAFARRDGVRERLLQLGDGELGRAPRGAAGRLL